MSRSWQNAHIHICFLGLTGLAWISSFWASSGSGSCLVSLLGENYAEENSNE